MIDKYMRDKTEDLDRRLRAFGDDPPSDGMIQDRFDTTSRLQPRDEVWQTPDGRVHLCDGAFESGYDAAIMHAKEAIKPLLSAASDLLNASYHSETFAKATVRNRLADALRQLGWRAGGDVELTGSREP